MSSLLGALADTVNTFIGNGRANDDGSDPIISRSDIVKEGWLQKESRNVREWRRRYVVLTRDCLATFREGPCELYRWSDATELVNFGQMMTVRSADHETNLENSFCLQRQKDGKFFFFCAESPSEKESWVGAVGRAMVRRTVMISDEGMDDHEDEWSDNVPIATNGSHNAGNVNFDDDWSSAKNPSMFSDNHYAGPGAGQGALPLPPAQQQFEPSPYGSLLHNNPSSATGLSPRTAFDDPLAASTHGGGGGPVVGGGSMFSGAGGGHSHYGNTTSWSNNSSAAALPDI
ncbi:unnamed protein product [Amoebophrya sp. A120]|nr:unnamed protein product [Amoebophrya sp. A120]|eukprot:GSA120T00018402001.1